MEGMQPLTDGNPGMEFFPTVELKRLVEFVADKMPPIPDGDDFSQNLAWVYQLKHHFGQHGREIKLADGIRWLQYPKFRKMFTLKTPKSETTSTSSLPSSWHDAVGNQVNVVSADDGGAIPSTSTTNAYAYSSVSVVKKRKKSELETILEDNSYGVDTLAPRKAKCAAMEKGACQIVRDEFGFF